MALVGADIDQLQKLGDDLRSKQVDIDHIITTVRSALGNTVWQGPARERLEGDWHSSFEPALGRMKEAFDSAGTECKSRASGLQSSMT
jgi:hypothetical protein